MTPLRRFATTITPFFVLGACAQLIGLSDYDKGEAHEAGAGGEGDASSGGSGAKTSGGTGGSSETGGTAGVLGTGGRSRGGTAGDGGAAGDPGGDSGVSGTNATGGSNRGGSSTGGSSMGGSSTGGSPTGGTPTGGNAGKGGAAGMGGQGGSAGAGATSGSGGSGGSPPCTEVTVGTLADLVLDRTAEPHLARYVFAVGPNLGLSNPDYLEIQFWNGGSFLGIDTGAFTLGTGRDSNNSTCARCFLGHQDDAASPSLRKIFFQTAGTLTVSSTSQQMDGFPDISYSDVTLREATIDAVDGHSTIVPGGACLHIASASFSLPPEWLCNPAWLGDGECDCGCGVPDTDCTDATDASCQFCWCDEYNIYGDCPSFESPASNWMCL